MLCEGALDSFLVCAFKRKSRRDIVEKQSADARVVSYASYVTRVWQLKKFPLESIVFVLKNDLLKSDVSVSP